MSHNDYKVEVDDNFHYGDEKHRYEAGSYPTLEAAIRTCEEITISSLRDLYEKALDAAKLRPQWTFGR